MMTNAKVGIGVTLLLSLPNLCFGGATPAQKCAVAKSKAAVKKTAAKAKCYQKSMSTGATVDTDCLNKAELKFNDAIAKAEVKGGCIHTGDAATIEAAVDACVSSLVALTPASDCTPSSSCMAGHACISLTDNSAQNSFGLRMAQLTFTKPTALATGLVGNLIASSVEQNESACNLTGNATFNWLLQPNKGLQTLKAGGAKPVADPTQGYSFESDTIFGFPVAPVTTNLSLTSGAFSTSSHDMAMPVYLDAMASSGFILPLSAVSFTGQLSSDQNCIGSYNSAGLTPTNNCSPDSTHPAFLDGGAVHAYITLENADAAIIASIGESLCVVLSGNAGLYGDGGHPAKCKRSSGTIVVSGDYCSATDSPGGCADSMEFNGTFAASAVKINN